MCTMRCFYLLCVNFESQVLSGERPALPEGTDAFHTTLMNMCVQQDPKQRPSAQGIVDFIDSFKFASES
jgi:hypothetical protein